MKRASVHIRIDRPNRVYLPGDTIAGSYSIEAAQPETVQAAELSILWHTEGKGDEDFAVHHFERISRDVQPDWDPSDVREFTTALPNSPLSYDGIIVKIRWRIRVRMFLAGERELVEDLRFQLGHVPTAIPVPIPV